ncbi:MAG TPA: adenylyl-sulfate kinase [Chitinophagaceae bacterium]|nr:adenylyl-sulfate kinase [Chitinophagaceae bacterium]
MPHDQKTGMIDRHHLNGHRSLVIWFTGLSGSGRSTLANMLERYLQEREIHTFILDGDHVGKGLNRDLDFSDAGRNENIRCVGEVAKLMMEAGLVVIAAFISPFREKRRQLRTLLGKETFVEVFVDTPIEICEKRDTKGLYRKARMREIAHFTGISSPYEYPENPDIRIDSSRETPEESISKIISFIWPNLGYRKS